MYEYTEDDLVVINLFHARCILCKQPFHTIHEIETRGAIGKEAMQLNNRVTLCKDHHDWAHTVGSNIANPILLSYRDRILANE